MIASIVDSETIIVNDLKQFDPYAILHSGQIFRYWKIEEGWLVLSCNHWAKIIEHSDCIKIICDDSQYFYRFFDCNRHFCLFRRNAGGNHFSYGGRLPRFEIKKLYD
ncbi:MAG: hypothetical protein IKT33_00900, partial [Clostridia bacterium]|nr:hypothetical protein [Clostridia bacterium]